MSKLIELLHDAYPYGVRGDVVSLSDKEVAELEKLGKSRNLDSIYQDFKSEVVEETAQEEVAETVEETDSKKAGKK